MDVTNGNNLFRLAVFLGIFFVPSVLAATNHNGTDWAITSNTTAFGYHYNISTFTLSPGVTLTIDAFNGSDQGFLTINASRIYVYGTITGDGRGGGGGSGGGGGGGNDGDGSFPSPGAGGTSTNQAGSDGGSGGTGTTYACGAGTAAYGGAGGNGYNGTTGGSQTGTTNGCSENRDGGGSTSANANNDTSTSINASMGRGGGGGGGGKGGARQSGNDGGGGGGGGMGGDGGAYAILIAQHDLKSNGTFNLRSGQTSCGTGSNGNNGQTNDGYGGTGASNNQPNCAHSTGGSGGTSLASGGYGGNGASGGTGSGGAIVIAAYNVNLSGTTLNVTGGTTANGGTIKILYKNSVTANGTYQGYSGLVYSQITDPYFTPETITETEARNAIIAGLDQSEINGNYTALADHQVAIRLANGTQYAARFDLFIKNANKRWAFNYDANASNLPIFANITPVLYVWQQTNMTTANITNDVSTFINATN